MTRRDAELEAALAALPERVAEVRGRIERAATAVGRDPAEVTLVAVTKTHPPALAVAAVEAGVPDLGENRSTEFAAKRRLVDAEVADARWHFVGQLQRRAAGDVVGDGVLVHSVDRRSLVDRIQRLAEDAGLVQRVLVQVNVGDDPAKGGCGLDEVADLVAYARERPNVAVEGLMTVPPLPPEGADANTHARPHLETLAATRDHLAGTFPEVRTLSMGMTADLEAAVAAGATHVRVGTALFGSRGTRPWEP